MSTEALTERELDCWLAEHLFGWIQHASCELLTIPHEHKDDRVRSQGFDRYSSTGDGMLAVMEAMQRRWFGCEIVANGTLGGGAIVRFSNDVWRQQWVDDAQSLPRAVAIAAKAALEIKP